jgi:HAD superfamily hydrolase (TIGR01450 family)
MCGPAGEIKKQYQPFEGFIIDIEGVLIKGEMSIPNAQKTIDTLIKSKKKLIFLSNISDLIRDEVSKKLIKLGFNIAPTQILTSAYATVLFLEENYPGKRNVFLIGTDSFKNELTDNDFNIVDNYKKADTVIVGLDYQLNYTKICDTARAIKNGSLFIASNLAKIKLTGNNYTIGPGFTVKGLEYVTGKKALLVGKPSKFMFGLALDKMGVPANKVLTIGDKLEEDIFGGNEIGTRTCLVLSGATSRSDIRLKKNAYKLDFIIETISELIEHHGEKT